MKHVLGHLSQSPRFFYFLVAIFSQIFKRFILSVYTVCFLLHLEEKDSLNKDV